MVWNPEAQRARDEWEKALSMTADTSYFDAFKKKAEDAAKSAHAKLVQESISRSAADAAASATRASREAAFYDALSKAAANQNAAIASANASYFENLQHATNLAKRGIMPGSLEEPATNNNDVIQSAAEGYEKSMTDENYNLPEVEVKSDFGKYLLIGGGVLLAIYLLRGQKKNA